MLSSGFKLPKKNILLSIGAYKQKEEMKESVQLLHQMGFKLFASYNTADFFNEVFKDEGIIVEHVEWAYENIGEDQKLDNITESVVSITNYLSTQKFDLVINLPKRTGGAQRVSTFFQR